MLGRGVVGLAVELARSMRAACFDIESELSCSCLSVPELRREVFLIGVQYRERRSDARKNYRGDLVVLVS